MLQVRKETILVGRGHHYHANDVNSLLVAEVTVHGLRRMVSTLPNHVYLIVTVAENDVLIVGRDLEGMVRVS